MNIVNVIVTTFAFVTIFAYERIVLYLGLQFGISPKNATKIILTLWIFIAIMRFTVFGNLE